MREADVVMKNQLFYQSRLRLARWYAGVMGAILALLSIGVYQAIAHAHSVTANRELQAVSDAVREAILTEITRLDELDQLPSSLLPNLCLQGMPCLETYGAHTQQSNTQQSNTQQSISTHPSGYYIRIAAPDGQLLAAAGDHPKGLPTTKPTGEWQSLKDSAGRVYHQRSLPLPLQTGPQDADLQDADLQDADLQDADTPNTTQAYLLVGSPFQEFHTYLSAVRWSLLIGLVLSVLLIAAASWWLAAIAMRPIYQSYQQIQQFTADAAHELRTPIAAIQATVESVLRLPHLSEQAAQETLTIIGRQNKRLTALVSDLLLLSRFDSGRFDGKQQRSARQLCCLPDVLNDIAEEMAAVALRKKIALSVDIQVPPDTSVIGSEEQLYRLILNLVNNALAYTPEDGSVVLSLKQQQKDILISVSDTGIGIDPAHQENIFDRFYRVDAARTGQMENAGLGLAIAKAIAAAHGGYLAVSSQLGEGSRFTLYLPLSQSLLRS